MLQRRASSDGRSALLRQGAADALHHLVAGTSLLQLSVDAPERVAGWDAVILTASNDNQARLFEGQLEAARRRGLIPERTRALAVPDPDGRRIGSGGATLHALRALRAAAPKQDIASWRVLLVHAGGDSRRVPWASVFGKCFIPLPLFADPDRPVPTLFDHQLAMAAPLAARMPRGALLSMAGDVLPLFNAWRAVFPEDGACVVTTRASLDVAERHGVIVADEDGRVTRLLQKSSAQALREAGALVGGGAALLDTGIHALSGQSFAELVAFAHADPNPVDDLLSAGVECSLYEDIAAAFVPAQHEDLRKSVLGGALITALGRGRLCQYEAADMRFVHFGSSGEVLGHLARGWNGRLSRTVLGERGSAVDPGALVLMSSLDEGVPVGEGSLVFGCVLREGCRIGKRCVAIGLTTDERFDLPDNGCLWQVPLRSAGPAEGTRFVTPCCGVDDNPKASYEDAIFLNRDMAKWMKDQRIGPEDLWGPGEDRTLWAARLFAVGAPSFCLSMAEWLVGHAESVESRERWLRAVRLSLGDIAREIDPAAVRRQDRAVCVGLARHAIQRTAELALERNLAALAGQLCGDEETAGLSDLVQRVPERGMPASRLARIRADLLQAAGERSRATEEGEAAFRAVQDEVAGAVMPYEPPVVAGLPAGKSETVKLPVRFDVAGGWSDTPPYCLERPARVLNMALTLDGVCPVGATVETLAEPRWELILADANLRTTVSNGGDNTRTDDLTDPFTLLRTALRVTGFGSDRSITQGVRVRTWAHVPRGSGLGTSSILGAALIRALQRIAGKPDDTHTVSDLVLVLEQRMTTGGGWQDQIGGLVPGIKCTSSAPVTPMRLIVEPVPLLPGIMDELEQRLVIAFTGLERLAKNVLQIVVGRVLSRDRRALNAVARLVELADQGRNAVSLGSFDTLGAVMDEAWNVHQELDPQCSNLEVDAILGRVEDLSVGAKLAGAGGGGFLGVLGKDREAAARIRAILNAFGQGVRVYDWRLWDGERQPLRV